MLQKWLFVVYAEPQIAENIMQLLLAEGGAVIHIILCVIDFCVEHLHMFSSAPHSFGTHLSWVLSHFPLWAVPD